MLNVENTERLLNFTDNTTILNFENLLIGSLNSTDNTPTINVEFNNATPQLNFLLETYDQTWFLWKVILDFYDSYDNDVLIPGRDRFGRRIWFLPQPQGTITEEDRKLVSLGFDIEGHGLL